MLPVQFRLILRRQPSSSSISRSLISRPSLERSFYNFRARPHPIIVIWPIYATWAISRNSERATFSSSLSRTLISKPSRKHSFYNFRARLRTIFVIWPKYVTDVISRDSKTAPFFTRTNAHINIPTTTRALPLSFSLSTASNNRYLA